jgi:hypothetical protein
MFLIDASRVETTMKSRLTPNILATQPRAPWRFGRRWRGLEPVLRIAQLVVFALLGMMCARLVADGVVLFGRAVAG